MLDGLYSAASGLMAQQNRMDAVSNDIANVNTTGYKAARVAFSDLAYTAPANGAGQGVRTGNGAGAWVAGRSFEQGGLKQTSRSLDLAIEGPGFFRVRTGDGREALTRSGAFQMSANRELVTAGGARLVPPLRVPEGVSADDVKVGRDGTVSAGQREIGRIRLVDVPAPDGLVSAGENLYQPSAASGAVRGANSSLTQGALESSNVDLASSMVDMMDAQKSFALASQAVKLQDQAMEIANGLKR